MAAVLLATSCSKDDDNDVKKQTITSEQTTTDSNTKAKEIPFTLKVSNGKSLNKIAYAKNSKTNNIDVSFSESNQGKLQMALYPAASVDNQPITSLTLIDYKNGIFSGTISPEDLGTSVQAVIMEDADGDRPYIYSSTESLIDLMNSIPHVFESEEFSLSEGCEIELTDIFAYFEIIMSPDQHKMDVSTLFSGKTVELSKEGKVWIACPAVQYNYLETNFYYRKPQPGNLYTINRAGFVDLGIFGILWADKNIGATESNPYGDYYAWGEVEPKEDYSWATYTYAKFGDGNGDKEGEQPKFSRYCGVTNDGFNGYTDNYESLLNEDDVAYQTSTKVNSIKPWSMPSSSDFEVLMNYCDFVWTEVNGVKGYLIYPKNNIKVLDDDDVIGGNKVIGGKKVIGNVKGDNADVEILQHDPEKEPHIFLPACGDKDGKTVVDGDVYFSSYWASTFRGFSPKEGNCFCIWEGGYITESSDRKFGFKVRAVIFGVN